MQKTAEQIYQLVQDHLDGVLTDKQQDDLDAWIEEKDSHMELFELLTNEEKETFLVKYSGQSVIIQMPDTGKYNVWIDGECRGTLTVTMDDDRAIWSSNKPELPAQEIGEAIEDYQM